MEGSLVGQPPIIRDPPGTGNPWNSEVETNLGTTEESRNGIDHFWSRWVGWVPWSYFMESVGTGEMSEGLEQEQDGQS